MRQLLVSIHWFLLVLEGGHNIPEYMYDFLTYFPLLDDFPPSKVFGFIVVYSC